VSITVQWSHIGLGSVVAFLIGWFIFGPLGAIAIAIVVLILMGVIKIR
jgi:multidrug transporter EmrE-like cation transporter